MARRAAESLKRVLVTGATGFVGRACLPQLARRGFEIHAVSRRVRRGELGSWRQLDLLDRAATEALVAEIRPTHLVHLAWGTSEGRHWDSRENVTWLAASQHLIEAFGSAGGRRLVAAGTCAEYGPSATACSEEDTPIRPRSMYGACKAALATLIPAYAATLGIESWAWARLFHPYGPGDRAGRFIPTLIDTLHRRERIACTPGRQLRDFLYVDDCADALARLVDSDVQGAINIASGEPIPVRQFVAEIGRQLDALDSIDFGARPASSLELGDLVADVRRQAAELAFCPATPIVDGIERTIAWYRARGRFDA
ncbi:MAG: NAD(P)-dependent oxidoreductase [Chloroflexota bacterium]